MPVVVGSPPEPPAPTVSEAPPAPVGSEPAPPLVVEPDVAEVEPEVVADEPEVADVELEEELVLALLPVPATVAPWELVVVGAKRSVVFAWPQLTLPTSTTAKKGLRRMVDPWNGLPHLGSSSATGPRLPAKRAARADCSGAHALTRDHSTNVGVRAGWRR
jgi:hypothetical protein